MIIGWKAWFVDIPKQATLQVYSSEHQSFESLPKDGCLGMLLFEDTKRPDGKHTTMQYAGYDYYFRAGEIYGVDIDSRERRVLEEISTRYQNPTIIRGIWTTNDTMQSVSEQMEKAKCQ